MASPACGRGRTSAGCPGEGGARTRQARRLRHDSTLAEGLLWRRLRNRGLAGAKFRRQHPVGPYVADLCCAEAMLIIEVDGSHHGPVRDAQRTAFLESEGYTVLRFWNIDILQELEGVLLRIEEALTRSR
ncbi:MAG: endonuclease domain-containing protein [Inquilinus sp.]|uniref:endonuclease domain-containing protein n=1 Tax=Inquilinus sp. TaxID=1932117 RepID=UPI003F35FE00